MRIRPFEKLDWVNTWQILRSVFGSGETYAVAPDITEAEARSIWTGGAKRVFVAVDDATQEIIGTYYLKANYDGPGDHVCNCGYVVSETARGQGVASQLYEHSEREAQAMGFRAMQFNLVVSSNEGAIRLWQRLGFDIVGTLPGAFRHPSLGYVDAYVMYKTLV